MKVSFVIVNYHGIADTLECLDSLSKIESKHDWSVVVVNVEDNQEADRLEEHQAEASVVRLMENLGYSGANNRGMALALEQGAEVVVLLNNDTTVDKKMLDPLVQTCIETDVGMVSPKIYFSPGREYHREEYRDDERGKVIWYAGGVIDWQNVYAFHWGVNEVDHAQHDELGETDFVTGCCLAVRSEVITQIGMLDEGYFLYLEDVDWSIRAQNSNYKTIYQPKSVVWHKNAGSTGGSGSKTQQHYQAKSRLRFTRKHASWRSKLAVYRNYFSERNVTSSPPLVSHTSI